jgi:hypothetical protein
VRVVRIDTGRNLIVAPTLPGAQAQPIVLVRRVVTATGEGGGSGLPSGGNGQNSSPDERGQIIDLLV